MTSAFTESIVEDAALAWLAGLGYTVLHGPEIAAGEPAAERSDLDYRDVMLEGRLRQKLRHLNPDLPAEALEDAYRKLTRSDAPSLVERNRAVHRMLIEGIPVEYLQPLPRSSPKRGAPSSLSPLPMGEGSRGEGLRRWGIVRVIDFEDPSANDWLAVNQFTVAEGQHMRRPDVVLFVNGLPLGDRTQEPC
jgi:type I restriction enzyme, R subunit